MDTSRRRSAAAKRRTADVIFILLVLAALIVVLLSIFGPTIYLVSVHEGTSFDIRDENKKIENMIPLDRQISVIEVDELEHEELFQKTIKSCLPYENKKCKQYVPDPIDKDGKKIKNGKKVERVAVIAPPGDISNSLLNRVEEIAHEHNKHNKGLPINIIQTTHVPPYGYGKTHGLTRIIRLIPQPLIMEVTDALTSLLQPGESIDDITLDDLIISFRMILRLHCRLSHVAAHTALQSISFFELLSDIINANQQIHRFLVPDDNDTPLNNKEDNDDDIQLAPDDDQTGLMDAELAYGTQLLTHIQEKINNNNKKDNNNNNNDLMKILDNILLDELKITKNMTVWPCPSFWLHNGNEMSTITKRLAKALSPDCNDVYVSCFVDRDKCEFNADPVCKKTK